MLKKNWVLFMVMGGIFIAGGAKPLFADGGSGVVQVHPIDVYPNCEREVSADRTSMLTKDPLVKVKKFFESHAQKGDKFEAIQQDGEQGFRLNFHAVIDGKAQSIMEVELRERAPNSNIVDALGALKAQVIQGNHTEQEFQAMEKKYRNLTQAYFRQVEDEQGRNVSEDSIIHQRAKQAAYPDKDKQKSNQASDQFKTNKAKAQDLKAQMRALKAKGDIAGMMKLAQQSKMSNSQANAVQGAMEVAQKDTWDIWAKCLEETATVTYWTKIVYNTNALPVEK